MSWRRAWPRRESAGTWRSPRTAGVPGDGGHARPLVSACASQTGQLPSKPCWLAHPSTDRGVRVSRWGTGLTCRRPVLMKASMRVRRRRKYIWRVRGMLRTALHIATQGAWLSGSQGGRITDRPAGMTRHQAKTIRERAAVKEMLTARTLLDEIIISSGSASRCWACTAKSEASSCAVCPWAIHP